MIVDSSAIVALAWRESTSGAVERALAEASNVRISSPVWFETQLVLTSPRSSLSPTQRDLLMAELRLEQVPFTAEHAATALDAWQRYGRGNHPAGLNFADCMSYATAVLAGEPLLFVGDDFAQTDVAPAVSG